MASQTLAAPTSKPSSLGDPSSDHWLRKQFNFRDVEHLIKTGRILSLVYDTETTDLNHMFAALTQFSGMIVDLQGRIIDQMDIQIQVPEDVALSPQAALVTQSKPEVLYSSEGRVSPHIAAGQIMLFFRNPYRKLWDKLGEDPNNIITVTNDKSKETEARVYTITPPEGGEPVEIRLHQGGKFLSYRYPDEERLPDGAMTYHDSDGTRWRRIAAPAMTEGYNNKRFDDRVLWQIFHRAMSEEIFLTHTKNFRRFRVDSMDLAKLVALLDQGGENGFRPGEKIDPKTNKPYKAFTLSSVMEANTRDPVPERGLDEGVRMPDGSKYDRRLAHDAKYDVFATIALKAYLRKRAPDVLRVVEENSDFDRIKPFLMSGEGFEPHPVLAFARNVYPQGARLHFGVCAGINEEIEERRQAVMIRTDLDQPLEAYTFRGKKLLDMSASELAAMLESQRGKADALCEVIDLRKNPPVVPADMAFERGLGGDPERHEANRRFVIAHEELGRKLIEAHSITMPPMPDYRTIRNPQPEEHLFTPIASPKQYEIEMGDGQRVLLTETVHAEWVKALRRNRKIDEILRRVLKPQPIEFENRPDTLYAFIERMEAVDKDLQRYFETADTSAHAGTKSAGFKMLPPPDSSFTPPKWDNVADPENPGKKKQVPHEMTEEECAEYTANAVEYLWKLRAELMYELHDNTTQFTVQDRHGHDIPFPDLNTMKQGDLADRLRTGEYTIQMEELNYSSELIARMFRDAGRIEWVKNYMILQGRDEEAREWKDWEKHFAAERALRLNGAPHEDTDLQRWMTATKGLKEIARLRNNLRTGDIRAEDDEWGLWDIFMHEGEMAERILDECEEFFRHQLAENPQTPETLTRLGYNPETGFPIEHAHYEVPDAAKVMVVDVPDRMLEAPLSHHHVASKIVMLNPDEAQREALTQMDPSTYLFLRGEQSGRTYLAAKATMLAPYEIEPSPYFREVYAAAATRFEDSGVTPPPDEQFLPLAVEALEPVPGKVTDAQTIKIRHWEDFMATVSPTLGYRDDDQPLTGFVIKHEGFVPIPGRARLQGMEANGKKPGQIESGWEVPTIITDVQTITLREAKERIKVGQKQMEAVAALGMDSVDALRGAIADGSLTKAHIREADLKKDVDSLNKLTNLLQLASFTHEDAVHYGYAGLKDMKSKLTALFVDQELSADREENLIHFVDIEPADKAKMTWYREDSRPRVSVGEDAVYIMPRAAAADEPEEEMETSSWRRRVGERSGYGHSL